VVSKNGNLLLNVGPRGNGEIPAAARDTLLSVGAWLKINGEAIYGTRPWTVFGEGPTETANGSFAESKAKPYTEKDFRFTTRKDLLYAIQLAPPQTANATITAIHRDIAVKQVGLLGTDAPLRFAQTGDGLTLTLPAGVPLQPALVYRIQT
jgi:alpha-L-fucosidase